MQHDFFFNLAQTFVYVFVDVGTEAAVEDTMEILLGGIDFMNLNFRINTKGIRTYALKSFLAYGNTLGRRAGTTAIGSVALLAGNALVERAKGNASSLSFKVGSHLVSSFAWWRSTNAYHTYVFLRLYPTKILEWFARKTIPLPLRQLGQDAFGIGSDPKVRADYFEHLQEVGTNYGVHVSEQGPWAAVLHVNLIPYASEFIMDQLWWTYMYAKERKTWRRVAKAHAIASTIMLSEISAGLLVRYVGARIGHTLLPRENGVGAFLCENVLHWVAGYLLSRHINRLCQRVHIKLDEMLPATEADVEAEDAEQEEMHREEEAMRDKFSSDYVASDDNFYALLGVKSDATEEEIRKTYRKLALTLHPDKLSGLPEAEREEKSAVFKKVSHAYSVLSNPDKRAVYDRDSKTPKPPDFIAKLASKGPIHRAFLLAGLGTALVYVGGAAAYLQILTIVKMLGSPGNVAIRSFVMAMPL